MANDHILVSTQEMEAAITKYEQARETLQNAYTQLDNAKDHLDHCYSGPAKAILIARYVDISLNVRTADRAIDESVNGLRGTIAKMDEAESDNSNRYASLDTGKSAPTYL